MVVGESQDWRFLHNPMDGWGNSDRSSSTEQLLHGGVWQSRETDRQWWPPTARKKTKQILCKIISWEMEPLQQKSLFLWYYSPKVVRLTSQLWNPWVKEVFRVPSCTSPNGVNKEHEWGTLAIARPLKMAHSATDTSIWYCTVGVPYSFVCGQLKEFKNWTESRKPRLPGHPPCVLACHEWEPRGSMQLVMMLLKNNRHDATGNSYQRLINVSL